MTTQIQIAELLDKLKRDRVYGTVSLQLKAGHLELIRVETTIKPEGNDPHDNNRSR
jgi:hypothetical protein